METPDSALLEAAVGPRIGRRGGRPPGIARRRAAPAGSRPGRRRGVPWIEILAKDVSYGLRGLRRNPAFTLAAVLSLALGIGANTAIFSFVDTLMLRMLPVEKPEQLLNLYRTGGWGKGFASYPLYLEFRKHTDLFTAVMARGGTDRVRFDQGHNNSVEYVLREYVTGNYFVVLGVRPAIGRLFKDEDNRTPQGHPFVILSYDFWRNRLALDPAVLGRVLTVDEQPLTVIGVAAPGFHGVEVESHADLWVPAMMFRGEIMQPGMHWMWIMARSRPEISGSRVQAAANTMMQQYLMIVYGGQRESAFGKWALEQKIEVREAGVGISLLREAFGKPLTILMAAVGLVLLIACANVANLLIARGAARRREIAMRFSLGATRWRLVRQWLIESLMLALLGSILGLAFAIWGERYMLLFLPPGAGERFDVAPNSTVLAFTLGISVLSAVFFGLAPALRATSLDPAAALKDGGSQQPGRGARASFRKALVVLQVALSVVLVVAAGLFANSLAGLRSINPGFVAQNVVTFSLDCPRAWKNADKGKNRQSLLARLTELPVLLRSVMGYRVPTAAVPGARESVFPDRPARPKKAWRLTSRLSVPRTLKPSACGRCGAGNSTRATCAPPARSPWSMRRSSVNSCLGRKTRLAASSALTIPSPKAASQLTLLAWCATFYTTA